MQQAEKLRAELTLCRQASEALHEECQLSAAILDTISTLIVVFDLEGHIIRFNSAFEQLTGYRLDEVKNQPFWDLFLTPDDLEPVKAVFRQLQLDQLPISDENDWITKDGSRRRIAWSYTPFLDSNGALKYVISTGVNITERDSVEPALHKLHAELESRVHQRTTQLVKANVELQAKLTAYQQTAELLCRSEARFRALIEQSPLSIQMLSPDGRIQQVNRAWEQLFNLTLEEVTHYNMLEDPQLIENGVMTLIQRGFAGEVVIVSPICYDAGRVAADGKETWAHGILYPIKDEVGKVAEVVLVHQDTTDWWRVEQARREAEAEKQAAILLERERASLERVAELAKANEVLKQTLDVLATDSDLDRFVGHVLKAVAEHFDAPVAEYWSDSKNIACLELSCWQGEIVTKEQLSQDPRTMGIEIPPQMVNYEALEQRQHHFIVEDLITDPIQLSVFSPLGFDMEAWCKERGVRQLLNIPLRLGNKSIGALVIYIGADRRFTDGQIELAYALAQQVTLAIRLNQLAESAQQAAIAREQEKAATLQAAELAKANEALQTQVAVRKQTEMALLESERRFRGIFEQAAVGIALTSLSGRWLQVNQRLCDIVGYSPSELLALTFQDITQPQDLPADLDSIPRLIRGEICTHQLEKQYIRKDGSLQWVHLTVSVARDDTGAASYFICIIQDISQRKEAEVVALGQQMALKGTLNFLATEPELDKFLGHVLTTVSEQLGAAVADIWLDDAEKDLTWLHLTSWQGQILKAAEQPDHPGATPVPVSRFRHYSCWQSLHSRHQPYVYHDLPNHPEMGAFREWAKARGGVLMALLVPLVFGSEYLGTFMIGHLQDRPYRASELELATTLAQQVVLAIQLTRLAEQAKQEAQQAAIVEERNRMAREIHDTLAQAFTGLSIHLGITKRFVKSQPESAITLIEQAISLAHAGLAEARRSVWALLPDADAYRDLVQSLGRSLDLMTASTSIQTQMLIQGNPRLLPSVVGLNLLRIGQEALTNALKYAQAQQIVISIQFTPEAVSLCVQDDGRGFDPSHHTQSGGFGILGMRQRCDRIGAQLTIRSQPGQGAAIVAFVPLV